MQGVAFRDPSPPCPAAQAAGGAAAFSDRTSAFKTDVRTLPSASSRGQSWERAYVLSSPAAYDQGGSPMVDNGIACILAGGEGKRLRPLTAPCAKPTVRFAGSYRLIDFSLRNCLNSYLRKILVFPQYQALSLEHHLRQGGSFLRAPLGAYVRTVLLSCRSPPRVSRHRRCPLPQSPDLGPSRSPRGPHPRGRACVVPGLSRPPDGLSSRGAAAGGRLSRRERQCARPAASAGDG